jgi:hypothetical protein
LTSSGVGLARKIHNEYAILPSSPANNNDVPHLLFNSGMNKVCDKNTRIMLPLISAEKQTIMSKNTSVYRRQRTHGKIMELVAYVNSGK